jgi:hypothetical protein
MRKRHDAHPRVEMMETRLVLSGVGIHHSAFASRAAAAHLMHVNGNGSRRPAPHTVQLVHTRGERFHAAHALARPHKAASKSTTNSLSADINNFFKSIFGNL